MTKPRISIVCGSGPGVMTLGPKPETGPDLLAALAAAPRAELIAVNLTGLYLPTVHHLVSLHPSLPAPLRRLRLQCDWVVDKREKPVTHSYLATDGIDQVWPLPPEGKRGTSSLFAVHVALNHLGYDRVILAGVPMDGSGRFLDAPGATVWPHHDTDTPAWQEAAATWLAGRVSSVSGWTRHLLGGPPA